MPFVSRSKKKFPYFFKNNVLVRNPDTSSLASLVLLKKQYFWNEYKNGLVLTWKDAIDFSRKYLNKVLEREGSLKCYLCGKDHLEIITKNKDNMATVDHYVPTSAGGSNDESNLRVACNPCNSKKGNKIISEEKLCA